MRNYYIIIVSLLLLGTGISVAQIGVGTSDPQAETLLDIFSENKGLLIPRISVDNFDTFNLPVGSQTESLLLYNTNILLGKGFTFWNGIRWSHVNNDFYWNTYGDNNVLSSSFLGTSDLQSFILGTQGTPRLEFTTSQRLISHNIGNRASPAWTIIDDQIGAYSTGNDLTLSLNNSDYLSNSITNGIVVNPSQEDINFIINDNSGSVIEVDANLNSIGIDAISTIESVLHIQGATSNVRVQSLSDSNVNNNGVDKALLYVDNNGQFKLEPTPHITQLPQFEFESSYMSTPLFGRNAALGALNGTLYTTTQELFEDGLLEVVYQTSIAVRNHTGGPITDGLPRKYGIRIKVNGRVIGQTSKMYTSVGTGGSIASGFMYLNGKGYIPLTGATAGTIYTIEVELFVDGGGLSTEISVGESLNDFFEVIVHY